ncbi:MAG: lmo0937 family membrane protein [Pseudomonadota bacterium]|nr:lmo0937 family membrane protein [Pseudomonadota bacterium]
MWIFIAIVLIACWALGFLLFHVSSFLIHILLVVAVIALIYHFVRGRRGAP